MIRVRDVDKEQCLNLTQDTNERIHQLRRLTVASSNPDDVQFLLRLVRNPQLMIYDIIACLPKSNEVLKLACESMEVDLISLDPSQGLKIKRSWLMSAINRGISFELSYCPDVHLLGNIRQKLFSFIKHHCELTRAKATILTSGCIEAKQLKSPYDVMSCMEHLGFSTKQAMASLQEHCQTIIDHGKSRRLNTETIVHWIPDDSIEKLKAKRFKAT
eukprot:g9234.t1